MPELISRKEGVVARKPHACMTCNARAVAPGDTYTRTIYKHDGDLYDWVQCTPCKDLAGEVYEWAWATWGVGRDEYIEWAAEHVNDPTHGPGARAFLDRAGITDGEGE